MAIPNFTDVTGLAGLAGAVACSLLLLLQRMFPLARRHAGLLAAAAFVVLLIPIGPLPPAAYLRGITGDVSITTLVLLGEGALGTWCRSMRPDPRQRQLLWLVLAFAAVVFYPMALGLGTFDPYRMGYGNGVFLAALLLLALVSWYLNFAFVALCVTLATAGWTVGWYESDNLWDYLLDPFLSVYAILASMAFGARALPRSGPKR